MIFNNEKFKEEEKALFETFLNKDFFKPEYNFYAEKPQPCKKGIELIVRPECNQSCSYCYIAQRGLELYPLKERVDKKIILNNLESVLNYFLLEKNVWVYRWELFSGDLFFDDFIFDVLDIFYKIFQIVDERHRAITCSRHFYIVIPLNFSFIENERQKELFLEYTHKFFKINVDIGPSCSTDGKMVSEDREGKKLDDSYFRNICEYLSKFPGAHIHSMISARNVFHWKENYFWWKDIIKDYPKLFQWGFQPYMLEVRNDDWDSKSIIAYIDFLDTLINDRFEMCNYDIDSLTDYILTGASGSIKTVFYDPMNLSINGSFNREFFSCSFEDLLHITLNNLAIVPCHRLSYYQFRAGNFILNEDNYISDFQPINPGTYLALKFTKNSKAPKCSDCKYRKLCNRGCMGAQYESTGELLAPIPSVCNLKQAKINFLLKKYKELGVFDSAVRRNSISAEVLEYCADLIKDIEETECEK